MIRNRKRRVVLPLLLALGVSSLVACSSQYRVTDPTTGNEYLTKSIKKRKGGSLIFIDAVSDRRVSLATWEMEKLKKREFKDALNAEQRGSN